MYELHSFRQNVPEGWRETILGGGSSPIFMTLPRLHGYQIGPPQPQHACNPPPGLLRWHYIQCVIRRFAHSDYKTLQNIFYYELSLRMKGESDDEDTDSECEWPSAALDHGQAMQMEIEEC